MIKKKISLLLITLLLFITGCNTNKTDDIEKTKITTNTLDDGRIYTSKSWYWLPTVNGEQIINYVEYDKSHVKQVPLLVGYSGYITVNVPNNIPYIYEYGLSVKAEDCSYAIDIKRNLTIESLIESYGLSGYKYLADNIVESQGNGTKTIIAIVDGYYGIIASIYSGDEAYSVIKDSMMNLEVEKIQTIYNNPINVEKLVELPESSVYAPTKEVDTIDLIRDCHYFADGTLIIQSEVQNFDDVFDKYATVLSVFAGQEVSHIYRGNSYTFMKAGTYSLGLVAYNTNTTIILMGDCPEAECNIVSIIKSLQ